MNINATLFVQALSFAALIWFTVRFVWPMITDAMDARAKRIADGEEYRMPATIDDPASLGEMHVTRRGYIGLANVDEGVTNVALVVNARDARDMAGNPAGTGIRRSAALQVRLLRQTARRSTPAR